MSKIALLGCLIATSLSFTAKSQEPPIEWAHAFGGTSWESAVSTVSTKDGGCIFVGNAISNDGDVSGNHGNSDLWVVKLDSGGILQWQKCLGGTYSETAYHIVNTFDGGFAICGFSNSDDGDASGFHGNPGDAFSDFWIVKTDSMANIQWQKMVGGSSDDEAFYIIQTSDSGFAVCGYSMSSDGDATVNHGAQDYWVVKLSKEGSLEWQKSLGGSGTDWAWAIEETDSGYMVVGNTQSYDGDVTGLHGSLGNADFWVVELDYSGDLIWEKCFGGDGGEWPFSILKTADNNFLIAGIGSSINGDVTGNHGQLDYWIIKINGSGDLLWEHSYGASSTDQGVNFSATDDGGYLFSGYSSSPADNDKTCTSEAYDYWVLKLDSAFSIQWQKCLGGSNEDYMGNGIQTKDGGYLISGETYSDDGDVTGFHGTTDAWIVKLKSEVPTSTFSVEENLSSIKIFPDPVISDLVIHFDDRNHDLKLIYIINNLGRNVATLSSSAFEIKLDFSMYPAGIYLAVVHDGNLFTTIPFVKE